jgi:hypothetical protein
MRAQSRQLPVERVNLLAKANTATCASNLFLEDSFCDCVRSGPFS